MPEQLDSKYWKEKLKLKEHPEGGFYVETYRSEEKTNIGTHSESIRNCSTAIYFLLESGNFSAFHRIATDEIWHHYDGDDAFIYIINEDSRTIEKHICGKKHEEALPQIIIPGGVWFASEVPAESTFCLVGCTVSPGFDFQDFELAQYQNIQALVEEGEKDLLKRLTRQ